MTAKCQRQWRLFGSFLFRYHVYFIVELSYSLLVVLDHAGVHLGFLPFAAAVGISYQPRTSAASSWFSHLHMNLASLHDFFVKLKMTWRRLSSLNCAVV